MSLNYDLSAIPDHKRVCYTVAQMDDPSYGIKAGDILLKEFVRCLIFSSLVVDLGQITERNRDEWIFRIAVLHKIDRNILTLSVNREELSIVPSPELLFRYIGLKCNVHDMKRGPWMNKAKKMLSDNVERFLRGQDRTLTKVSPLPEENFEPTEADWQVYLERQRKDSSA